MDVSAGLNDLIGRINDLVGEEQYSDFMLERVFRMKDSLVNPILAELKKDEAKKDGARELAALAAAVEEYVVCFKAEPGRRDERRKRIQGLKGAVRRRLLSEDDQEAEIELLLDEIRQWQVKTALDANGRIVYSTADGKQIPPRSIIAERVGDKVIERAVNALKPYSEKVRPHDLRGNPGGLVIIDNAQRCIVVGDLHGRYDNLVNILRDKNNLEDIMSGNAHLVFTGDAVHPRSSKQNDARAYEDSFCTMLLIMTLKAENPFNVHYLVGNHDFAHVGGRPASRGEVRQDELFEKYTMKQFGKSVFEHYREFVRLCPILLKVKAPNGYILMVHAGLSKDVRSEQGLINIFMKGPQGPELTEMLWSRRYDDREAIAKSLENVGARFMVVGHTPPTKRRAERYGLEVIGEKVFAHVHHLKVIINAQNNIFGYLDLDLTRPLPDDVTDLQAPGGRPAYRMLRPRNLASGPKS
jgi:Calcineurin-like phosphoesterase